MTLSKTGKITALLVLACMVSLLSLGFLAWHSRQKQKPQINVCLIVVDALRADHLACYGYHRATSPNIDKLAKEGVLFSRAFSHGTQTLISIPSLLTSLYPSVHRVLKNGAVVADEFITLPELLAKNGYATAAFVAPHLEVIGNLKHRFGVYRSLRPAIEKIFNEQKKKSSTPPRLIMKAILDKLNFTSQITEDAIGWLRQNSGKRFFIYIHFLDVHAPYNPPEPYKKLFWRGEIDRALAQSAIDNIRQDVEGNFLSRLPGREAQARLEYIISQYDAEVRFVDDNVGMLLDELKSLNLSDNTLVILTSDHGEEFLDHGQFAHGRSLYDEVLRVPLIMRLPRVIPEGKTAGQLARLIDIMPTTLDILNIDSGNNNMQGVSLMPAIHKNRSVALESFAETNSEACIGVMTQEWKFLKCDETGPGGDRYVLYNLIDDPNEMKNVAQANPEQSAYFENRIRSYEASCQELRAAVLDRGDVEEAVVLDEPTKEVLKSMGYAQ